MSEEAIDYPPSTAKGYNQRCEFQADRENEKCSVPEEGPSKGSTHIPENPPSSEKLERRERLRNLKRNSSS